MQSTSPTRNPNQSPGSLGSVASRLLFVILPTFSLFLALELGLTDARAAELDVKHTLEGAEDFLVGLGGTPLEVGNNSDGGIAPGSEVLLCQLGLHLGTPPLDDLADILADRLGLDDLCFTVDLGHELTLGGAFGLLWECVNLILARSIKTVLAVGVGGEQVKGRFDEKGMMRGGRRVGGETYSVASGILFLSADNGTATLSSVQGGVASHNSLALRSATTRPASNLSDGVPISHLDGCVCLIVLW